MVAPDCRGLLREGDELATAGDVAAAVRLYAAAARAFDEAGDALKAVALFRLVRDLIAEHALTDPELDADACARMAALYRALGLFDEADAVMRER